MDVLQIPRPDIAHNTPADTLQAKITPTGFREYDARWQFPGQINLTGIQAVGLGLGTQLQEMGRTGIVVGHDYRSYSQDIKNALMVGLIGAGCQVYDIGVCLSPVAYFAQFALDLPAVAMVTASHNPNGWTGIKIGANRPLTFGPDEMTHLKDIVLSGKAKIAHGGLYTPIENMREAYIADVAGQTRLKRKLRVVCATGNGTAGLFAPEILRRIGAEIIPLHTEPDWTFPNYNPNPEAMEMLHDIRDKVLETGADIGLGFDGDGDRCGVVDNEGEEIFADKVGVMLARDWASEHPGAKLVADVKSTGLFAADPVLQQAGITTEYWKTGHSHMKRRVHELGALAGFEKSGHYFLAGPLGRGYDDGTVVAREILRMLERNEGKSMADLRRNLPVSYGSPTMSPHCPDEKKYQVLERLISKIENMRKSGATFAGKPIDDIVTVNGARVLLEGGEWALVRASSNTPNLVVVCESFTSKERTKELFEAMDAIIRTEPDVGEYDQTL